MNSICLFDCGFVSDGTFLTMCLRNGLGFWVHNYFVMDDGVNSYIHTISYICLLFLEVYICMIWMYIAFMIYMFALYRMYIIYLYVEDWFACVSLVIDDSNKKNKYRITTTVIFQTEVQPFGSFWLLPSWFLWFPLFFCGFRGHVQLLPTGTKTRPFMTSDWPG